MRKFLLLIALIISGVGLINAQNEFNGHEYVDLGLPSGLLWATCNIGADTPEGYGDYYAWGETTTKETYSTSNSSTYGKTMNDISGIAQYDAARFNWGGEWRMPTKDEIDELRTKCSWKKITQNNVEGYKVIGSNGNYIFLPLAGYRFGTNLYDTEFGALYWSSTPTVNTNQAYHLSNSSTTYSARYYGHSVRPVYGGGTVKYATITTDEVNEITSTTAECGGNVTSDNGYSVTAKGVCWSTSENPTINDNKTTDGSGVGTFISLLNNLEPNTTYYVRAYATNAAGTTYGDMKSFTTFGEIPQITVGDHRVIDYDGYSLKYIVTSVDPAECEVICSTYPESMKSITIPSYVAISGSACSVTSISNNAFYNCSNLTGISIPNSVKSIGYAAFVASGLTNISIPNSVTNIGDAAFNGCYGLTSIEVKNDNPVYDSRNDCNAIIETSTNKLIRGCKNTNIPNSVTSIGNQSFNGSDIITISIPYGVTNIEYSAFSSCDNLKSIKCYSENVPTTGSNVFEYCPSDMKIYVPAASLETYQSTEPWNNYNIVTFGSVGDFMYVDYDSYILKYTITNLEPAECEVVCVSKPTTNTLLTIPPFVTISGKECSVTSIGDNAFAQCDKLTSITILSNVTSIGESAFYGCSSLTNIYCYAEDVPQTGSYVFYLCPESMIIYVPSTSLSEYEAASPWNNFTIEKITPQTITIDYYQRYSLKFTQTSVWPAECEVVCSTTPTTNTSVTIPQVVNISGTEYRVTSIGNDAFKSCSNLTGIEIPNTVTSIGNYAFFNCYNISNIEIPNNVTSIGNYAFYNCYNISNIEIPNGVTTIGSSAFYRCNIVSIPNSVTSIGSNAFESCGFESNSLKIPYGLTNIGSSVFYNCSSLKNVEISGTITSISNNAFSNCSNLSSVTFDENSQLTSIGYNAFNYCKNLESIELPNTVTTIGDNAFAYSGLKSVVIPNSVTSIGADAFYQNYLQSVVIPSSVTSIGNGAFSANRLGLGVYFYRTTPPTFGGSQFGYPYPNIYVPSISLESYKTAEYMTWYSENIIGMPTYTETGWTTEPTAEDNVAINHSLVIDGASRTNDILTVNTIGITEKGKLIIKNGGQLVANSVTGEVTVENSISGYGEELSWHTISSPLKAEVNLAAQDNGTNLLSGNYELYRYDEPTYTWQNYKNSINNSFTSLESGRGYIYANSENVTMSFTGNANTDDVVYNLTNDADVLTGFHLIGNPFTHNITADNFTLDNATLASGYYVLSNEGDWGVRLANDGVIKPTQGALIKATITDKEKTATLTLNNNVSSQRTKANGQDSQYLSISVSNDRYSDKAIALFGEGIGLDKINHQNENSPLLYIPMENTDYAVAVINKDFNEITVNFEAMTMGEYTISLKQENCEFEDLYLFDKQSGKRINILEEDYTFIASVNDKSDRFVLLKDNGQQTTDNSHFAYISGEELIVNAEGSIQIIDMMGRVVYSSDAACHVNRINVSDFNSAAYIIRCINENGINVQKIIL